MPSQVQNSLTELPVTLHDEVSAVAIHQVSVASHKDHVQWLGVGDQLIIQPESMEWAGMNPAASVTEHTGMVER